MLISNNHYRLTLSDNNGEIKSFKKAGSELIDKTDLPRALFTIRFRLDIIRRPAEIKAEEEKNQQTK